MPCGLDRDILCEEWLDIDVNNCNFKEDKNFSRFLFSPFYHMYQVKQ